MYGPVRTVLWEDGGFCPLLPDFALLAPGFFSRICLHLSRVELSAKTGDLPVDQVLKSLVSRRHFLFREQ